MFRSSRTFAFRSSRTFFKKHEMFTEVATHIFRSSRTNFSRLLFLQASLHNHAYGDVQSFYGFKKPQKQRFIKNSFQCNILPLVTNSLYTSHEGLHLYKYPYLTSIFITIFAHSFFLGIIHMVIAIRTKCFFTLRATIIFIKFFKDTVYTFHLFIVGNKPSK